MSEKCPKCGLPLPLLNPMSIHEPANQRPGEFTVLDIVYCYGTDSMPCLHRQLAAKDSEIAQWRDEAVRLYRAMLSAVETEPTEHWNDAQEVFNRCMAVLNSCPLAKQAAEASMPAAKDLTGFCPDLTGGLSTAQYLDEVRGAIEPEGSSKPG